MPADNMKTVGLRSSLSRIFRFGLIKVVPGVFNIALIPYLVVALGSMSYGLYSTWLGYAMLVANTVAAIVSQPMYRYLSSRPCERERFAGFAVVAALFAGFVSCGVSQIVEVPSLLALGFGTLAVGTVLGTAASIGFVVANEILRLAAYEGIRILAIAIALAVPAFLGDGLTLGYVVLAMSLSNILPLLALVRQQRFSFPDGAWLCSVVPYGLKSATWLVLAGLPVVSAKSILMQAMPDHAFGIYAAVADLTYRGFAIANAALMMWAFPLLSRQYDEGDIAKVRHTLWLSLLVYGVGGAAMLVGLWVVVYWRLIDLSALPGGALAAVIITLTSFGWHAMSIAHKPFELTLRTTQMAALMAVGVATFYGLTFALIRLFGLDALYVVTLSMAGVAATYVAISLSQKLER